MITVPRGDFGTLSALSFTGSNDDLTAFDQVRLKVWKAGSSFNPIVDGVCVVDSTTACHYVITATDFDEVGRFKYEVEGVSLSGQTVTGKRSCIAGDLIVPESP
jgi:hypothetical protein